ncbi:hypothetical protein BDR26DRAFT_114809 [Obelidium mucronatum]|nr:hypothetical protein BDR26DRAFT_114809 [Obelidium mucronatum]
MADVVSVSSDDSDEEPLFSESSDGEEENQEPLAAAVSDEPRTQDIFQEPKTSVKRKRTESEEADARQEAEERDTEPLNECIICYGNWTTQGTHRSASLKCGHLFGLKCIKDYLQRHNGKTCPICKAPAKHTDVRNVYAQNLTAVDDSTLRAAYAARDIAQSQAKALELENDTLKLKVRDLERIISSGILSSAPFDSKLKVRTSMFLSKGTVRVGAASWDHTGILYFAHGMGDKEFGVTAWNLEMKSRVFTPLHSGVIRDVKVLSRNGVRDVILSTGLDKKLKLYSSETDYANLSIDLSAPGWSCSFDTIRQHILYVGLGNNSIVQIYDTRNPSTVLHSLTHSSMGKIGNGVHSLQHIESSNSLVGGSLATSFYLEKLANRDSCFSIVDDGFTCVPLAKGGDKCTNAFYNDQTNTLFTSWRRPTQLNHVIETIARELAPDASPHQDPPPSSTSKLTTSTHIAEYHTPWNPLLARSRCFTLRSGIQVFATGSDGEQCALLHTVNPEGIVREVQRLGGVEYEGKVMDIVPVKGAIAVLTDSKVHLWG